MVNKEKSIEHMISCRNYALEEAKDLQLSEGEFVRSMINNFVSFIASNVELYIYEDLYEKLLKETMVCQKDYIKHGVIDDGPKWPSVGEN